MIAPLLCQYKNNIEKEKYRRRGNMKLLDQVRDVIRKKHYSIQTEQAYVDWIRRFILFYKKQHPKGMGEKEISQFISYLATKKNVASSTQNQALNAIVFLYKRVHNVELVQAQGRILCAERSSVSLAE